MVNMIFAFCLLLASKSLASSSETFKTLKELELEDAARNRQYSTYGKVLEAGDELQENELLKSGNGYYAVMQSDGNFVVYISKNFDAKNEIFSTGTQGQGTGPYRLSMQTDNNLVVYDSHGNALWHANSHVYDSHDGPVSLVLQTDGNLVIYDKSGTALWHANSQSYDCVPTASNVEWNASVNALFEHVSSGDSVGMYTVLLFMVLIIGGVYHCRNKRRKDMYALVNDGNKGYSTFNSEC